MAGSHFEFAQHGKSRRVGQRADAAHRADRRRAVLRQVDAHRRHQPRSGDHVLPDRIAAGRTAVDGRLALLRPRLREPEPARVHRPALAGARGRPAALLVAVGQRLPAVAAPGRAVPRAARTRCCILNDPDGIEPRPAAAACSTRCARSKSSSTRACWIRRSTRASPSTRWRIACRRRCPTRWISATSPTHIFDMYGAGRAQARHLRRQLPARAAAGRAQRALHPALSPGLGSARQPARRTSGRWRSRSTRPSAALVMDLKQRGLLDDTLVIWGGEFGRTNYSQGKLTKDNYGRDHHPRCFTIWMAGGGVKRGLQLRRDRRVRLQHRARSASTSTTSRRRCCTCSASITSACCSSTRAAAIG